MKKPKLNESQYGIWLSEKAFPGEAVNTIGFYLYFPEHGAEEICSTVNRVAGEMNLWEFKLNKEMADPFLEREESPKSCKIGGEKRKADALLEWGQESERILSGQLAKADVYPVREGGSFLSIFFHHILLDGYSMCQVAQKILDGLGGYTGKDRNYSALSEKAGQKEAIDGDLEKKFWLGYFDGVDAEPSVFGGQANGYKRNWHRCRLGRELTGRIKEYAGKHGLTEASVFSAALCLYLARATQKKDAVYLMPRLNRDTERERLKAGCFTLVVPVRVTVDEEFTFPELCRRTISQGRLASAHKAYGMDNIIRDLRNSGLIAGSLSEYTLNFYSTSLHTAIPYEIGMSMDGAMHSHLTLNITSFQDEYEIFYDARDGIYTEEMVRRFHEAFLHIIRSGMDGADAGKKVGDYEIVGEEERGVLVHMAGKQIPISEEDTIPSLFRKAAKDYACRPALYAGDRQFTYRELDALSNRVANALLAHGCAMGQTVMYKLKRDYRLIVAMLGILKAGCAFIPIDPEYPKGRIDYIQKNSGAPFLIASRGSIGWPDGADGAAILDIDGLLACENEDDPRLAIPQGQLAYCIYTSGTTGNPKGAELSHRGIANIVHADNNPFNRDIVKTGKGIVAIGSVCFDISLFEFFVPLLNGMFVEFAPEQAMADPAAIAGLLGAHGANMLHCTPSRLAAYLNNRSFADALKSVEVILSAGEPLPGSLVKELRDTYQIRIYNGYGPTETTIGATVTEAGDDRTIGKPIANTGILILDQAGRLLPYGATGEICIYGKGLGLGYRNLPEETKKRFVRLYGRGMYRTGDLGLFLPDGRILYHGRNDFQVKIRGLRIELAEVENCMMSYPGIGLACVQVRRIAGNEHLVGFYTVKDQTRVGPDELKAHLKEHLTLYMVPDILKELGKMPQTPGGKTDLRAIAKIPVEYVRTYREPENEFQKAICEAFGAVLGEARVGLSDNFFEIGGDSLHTAELVGEIEERIPEIRISPEDIFHYPTPELLAQFLYRQDIDGAKQGDNPLDVLDYGGIAEILAGNELNGLSENIEKHSLGCILLTGVTGFLGIHILMELVKCPACWDRIYCLIRPTERLNAEKRLKNRLFYFEGTDCADMVGERIAALPGDIRNMPVFDGYFDGHIDTVINCAADVSHFAYDDKLERTNTDGVENLLAFCERQGASFVQISTISVAGVQERGGRELTLTEKDLYIGQEIKNRYVLSKYMAEYHIFRAAAKGMPVKVMRVGNLQGRISDGEFQMNRRTNAFTRQISSYVKMGMAPESLCHSSVNFSPVDEVARMIVALSALPERYCVFHVYPKEEVSYGRLFSVISGLGHEVRALADQDFEREVKKLGGTKKGRGILEGILLERPDFRFKSVPVTDLFTQEMLKCLNLEWKPITEKYLLKYFTALEDLLMFEA